MQEPSVTGNSIEIHLPCDLTPADTDELMAAIAPAVIGMASALANHRASAQRAEAHIAPEAVARVCHKVNRAYCLCLGDETQVEWDEAPEWQRESCINGVRAHIDSKLTLTPEQSHEGWMREKLENGWKHGAVKSPELKLHPCLVPYAQLPVEQRAKDHIFRAIVHAMLVVPVAST